MNLGINPNFKTNYGQTNNNKQKVNFKSLSVEKPVLATAEHLKHFANAVHILDAAPYIRKTIADTIRKSIGNKVVILDSGFNSKLYKSTREQDRGMVLLTEVQKTLKKGVVTSKQIAKYEAEMTANDMARKTLGEKITANDAAKTSLEEQMAESDTVRKDLEEKMEIILKEREELKKQMGSLNHKRGIIETSIGL